MLPFSSFSLLLGDDGVYLYCEEETTTHPFNGDNDYEGAHTYNDYDYS